ncbi:hypothetical protein DLM78_04110 [Leptospira stimsonii]|uniref:Uncharacterized protein n=1 Tax=Leptospira stimsonii TaxID=2202203 RepID=A0A8B3CV69_9LEPT|nr:hypothetical protein DLM78_04110 [Leptospira stimsonii]
MYCVALSEKTVRLGKEINKKNYDLVRRKAYHKNERSTFQIRNAKTGRMNLWIFKIKSGFYFLNDNKRIENAKQDVKYDKEGDICSYPKAHFRVRI